MITASALPAPKGRVLVVEDDVFVALEIEGILGDLGFEVAALERTAAGAVAAARTLRVDVALLDYELSGPGDGISVGLTILREFGIRSVFVTAHADAPSFREKASDVRPLAFVAKPFRDSDIERALSAMAAVVDRRVVEGCRGA